MSILPFVLVVASEQADPAPIADDAGQAVTLASAVGPAVAPQTPRELLETFKRLFESSELLDVRFFTEERLRTTFGAREVKWLRRQDTSKQANVLDLGKLYSLSEQFPSSGVYVFWEQPERKEPAPNALVRAGLSAQLNGDARYNADAIRSVFGEPSSIENPYAGEDPSHPSALMRATHPLGNRALVYSRIHDGIEHRASFLLGGDGTMIRCNLYEERK